MSHTHQLEDLFAQLGLKNDHDSIERFIAEHHPLPNEVALYRAPIWNLRNVPFSRRRLLATAVGR